MQRYRIALWQTYFLASIQSDKMDGFASIQISELGSRGLMNDPIVSLSMIATLYERPSNNMI